MQAYYPSNFQFRNEWQRKRIISTLEDHGEALDKDLNHLLDLRRAEKEDRDQVKVGLIAVYTLVFALFINLISNVRRAEIFWACAAFAAQLGVFASGDSGRYQCPCWR